MKRYNIGVNDNIIKTNLGKKIGVVHNFAFTSGLVDATRSRDNSLSEEGDADISIISINERRKKQKEDVK